MTKENKKKKKKMSRDLHVCSSVYTQQSQSQYSTQPNAGMYGSSNMNMGVAMVSNSSNMSQMSGQLSSMNTEQVRGGEE